MEGPQVSETLELPTIRFRLPGQWFQIPLHSRDEARTAIERVVLQQVGAADDRATLRRELRGRLFSALEAAIDGDGQSMQIALNIVPEVPISASFSVFLPQVTLTPSIGTSPTAVMDLFERGLATATDMTTAKRFSTPDSAVLRLHRREMAKVDDKHEDLPSLMVDYWVTIPGFKRVVLLSFATVFSELEEVMLQFFDSIVGVTYWSQPEA
ncbi:MAG: hypothetical protein JWO10_843 [Microbacteriaceae bacterium]|nr:hypothetical protein [Microbacteriaceae bacterium]